MRGSHEQSPTSRTFWSLPMEGNHRVINVRSIVYAIVKVSAQMRNWCHFQPLKNFASRGGLQIACTCTARAACTLSHSPAHYLVTLVKQCQCTKFFLASSTFPKIRKSAVKSPLSHPWYRQFSSLFKFNLVDLASRLALLSLKITILSKTDA